jgi:DNA-binding IclR family transcriptional regulator
MLRVLYFGIYELRNSIFFTIPVRIIRLGYAVAKRLYSISHARPPIANSLSTSQVSALSALEGTEILRVRGREKTEASVFGP